MGENISCLETEICFFNNGIDGPQSLDALREILSEAMKRKAQVYDDLNQVTNQLSIILMGYGISLEQKGGTQILLFR